MKTLCFALAALAAHLTIHAAAADEPRAVVEAAYEAFAQGDMDRFAGLMAPDIVWNEAEGNPYADLKEPLNNPARSAFLPEKPQIVWCEPSDSSRSYGRGSQRARCGFSGETLTGRAFAGAPLRFDSLIWNNQTTLAKATSEHPAKAPSRPCRVVQRFLYPYEGPEALMSGLFSRLAAEWESITVTPSEYVVDDDRVVVFGRYDEVYKATGEHLDIPFVHSWTVADGKLAEFQQYTDTAALVAAMSRTPDAVGDSDHVASSGQLKYATGDPASWPAELDAVIAAPDNHEVLLENDYVRVLKVTLGPGEVEPLHSHRWPSVLHIQQAGHFLDRDAEGNVIFDSREAPPLELPLTMWKGPEAPHSPVNLSEDTEIRLIRVELKQAPTP